MIYVTVSTRNRFWHSSLTALSLANANLTGCFVHVLDDASDDEYVDARTELYENLLQRKVIHRYDALKANIGFCSVRELFVDHFLRQSRFSHWLHIDDDIIFSEQAINRAFKEYMAYMFNRGVLHLYVNPWCRLVKRFGPFAEVGSIGGASFIVPKRTLEIIDNPYTNQTDGEKANAEFWRRLAEAKLPMYAKWTRCYPFQHTGNVESTIFGHTPQWEDLYAKDLLTGQIINVPPFSMKELRIAVRAGKLSSYAWRSMSRFKNPIKLPAPSGNTVKENR